jgi:hypothetical protein
MKAIRSILFVLTIAVAFVTALPAHAAINLTWSFDAPQPVIGTPTTVFNMPATLVVAADSDDFVVGSTAINLGSFLGEYTFDVPPGSYDPIVVLLQAGDVVQFNFGTLTPAGPDFAAAPGDYVILAADLGVGPPGGNSVGVPSSNLFAARVVVDGVVPEPATLVLLVSGSAAAVWFRRRRGV